MFLPQIVWAEETNCDNATFQCVKCNYHYEEYFSYDVSYVVFASGKGTAEIKGMQTESSTLSSNKVYSNLKGGDFITEEKDGLYCPDIKAKTDVDENIEVTFAKNFTSGNLDTLIPEEIENNGLDFVDPDRENTSFKCDIVPKSSSRIPEIHVFYEDGEVTYSIDSDRYTVDNTFIKDQEAELFSQGCNGTLYAYCDNDVDKCYITTKSDFLGYEGVTGTDETSDEIKKEELGSQDQHGFEPDPLCGKNKEKCNISIKNVCEEPTVARTLQFLGFIVFLVKIMVPVIIIGMGVMNLFKIMTSDKPEEAPKYVKSILVRIIIGAIIFLLPSILSFIFGLAENVISSKKTTDFDNCVNCILSPNKCEIKK